MTEAEFAVHEYAQRLKTEVDALTIRCEELRDVAKKYEEEANAARRHREHRSALIQRFKDSAHLWEGKFHQVKRENNALRTALRKMHGIR